jgi:hypothetical protein
MVLLPLTASLDTEERVEAMDLRTPVVLAKPIVSKIVSNPSALKF